MADGVADLERREALADIVADPQFLGEVLDESMILCGLKVLEHLEIAVSLVKLAMDETDAARGLMRAVDGHATAAATVARDWRDGDRQVPSPAGNEI